MRIIIEIFDRTDRTHLYELVSFTDKIFFFSFCFLPFFLYIFTLQSDHILNDTIHIAFKLKSKGSDGLFSVVDKLLMLLVYF